jgi:3-oxoacyl-[acyl-carrier-protein] synthase II
MTGRGGGDGRSVAITGIGLVTPLATGTRESWHALCAGASGIGSIRRFDAAGWPVRAAGEVTDLDAGRFVGRAHLRHMDRYSLLAASAARLAIDDAALDSRAGGNRWAVTMGVGLGGLETMESNHEALVRRGPRFVNPYFIPMIVPNMAAGWISMLAGIAGESLTVSTACASGAHALGEALRALRRGEADVVVAGGAEAAVTPLGVAGFAAMRALSTSDGDPARVSRPFDEGRDGFVIAEGAGVLVLEPVERVRRRGGRIYALLAGCGTSSDAHDLTQPDPEGRGAAAAMSRALEDAGLAPEEVDHVNAHATSTPLGDRVEAAAIREVLGGRAGRVPVTSTKGATGHLLGAAGAVEAAFTALSIDERVAPATLNLERPGEGCELDHVTGRPRPAHIRAALCNAFGFGGTNATLVLTGHEEERR